MAHVLRSCSLVLALSLVSASALADKLTIKEAKVTVESPADWTTEKKGGGITLYSKDKNVSVQFYVVPAGSVGKAEATALKNLSAVIDKLRFAKEKKFEMNGMKGVSADGAGVLRGNPVSVSMTIFGTPSDENELMVVAIGVEAVLAKHKEEVTFVLSHITPEK
jgi:hypothetical protein